MESRTAVQNLTESIHCLLGLKTQLTPGWADLVCNIIKGLPSEGPSNGTDIRSVNPETCISSELKDADEEAAVAKTQDELVTLNAHLDQLNLQRRQVLNDYLDLKGNIRVFCRIRPVTAGDKLDNLQTVLSSDSCDVLLKLAEHKSKHYSFDKVFQPGSSQEEVFSEVEPVIKSALDGYNACIFAYGQTGTGKTFTMEGTSDCPGIVPRAIKTLFNQAADSSHTFILTFSMLEIYMGNLRDLLVPRVIKPTDPMPACLSIQTDLSGGIKIDNLVAIRVSDFNQAIRLYRLGSRFRSTASTNANTTSSRSHWRRETNKLWMVDLGGSERVLKTKAWGRRLEEGKAINLSLSALGDVISALQRRKNHVPYRNSKLTQVLRDSLGEDSKTLMLVHVSPKEEDLCETVCSLGFATRVRSIHLGIEQSTDAQAKKEIEMTKLLEKLKQLEYEHQELISHIKKLNERLRQLTMTASPSTDLLESADLSNQEPQSNTPLVKHSTAGVTAVLPIDLPRFMRPTICSRKKSDADYQTLRNAERKIPLPARRRRRAASVRAGSVSFPINNTSDYGSDYNTSRTSCLVGLNMKCSADYETEYSHDASDCEIKTVVFPEEEGSPRSLASSETHLRQKTTEKYGNRQTNKLVSSKCSNINKWLRLQRDEQRTVTHTHRVKRVLSIPLPERKKKIVEQIETRILHHEKVNNFGFTMKKIFSYHKHDKIKKADDAGVARNSTAEVKIDELPDMVDDILIDESGFNNIYSANTTENKESKENWNSLDGSVDKECSKNSLLDLHYDSFTQNEEYGEETKMPIEQVIVDATWSLSNGFMFEDSNCDPYSTSDVRNDISKLVITSEFLSGSKAKLTETMNQDLLGSERIVISNGHQICDLISKGCTSGEDHHKGDIYSPFQSMENGTRPCLHTLKSRRALDMDPSEGNWKTLTMSSADCQENTHDVGICNYFRQKLQIVCASALLGLGFESLGFGSDFFLGLIL